LGRRAEVAARISFAEEYGAVHADVPGGSGYVTVGGYAY
jgi:hypothetical protein